MVAAEPGANDGSPAAFLADNPGFDLPAITGKVRSEFLQTVRQLRRRGGRHAGPDRLLLAPWLTLSLLTLGCAMLVSSARAPAVASGGPATPILMLQLFTNVFLVRHGRDA